MKICIDPGHGGKDPGAIAKLDDIEYREKNLNLTAAYFLAGVLDSFGHEAILTRVTDEFLTLQNRVDQANDIDADLFISVHCNSFERSEPGGFEVWHYPDSDMGSHIASAILRAVRSIPWMEIHGEGIYEKAFHVLKYTTMPAILLELSFMSNEADLKTLVSLGKLFAICRNIGEAVTVSTS